MEVEKVEIKEEQKEEVKPAKPKKERKPLSASKYLALGYLAVIVTGGFLLCTPFARATFTWSWSSFASCWTNPIDAFFTATSAACVTGLITLDTATYWSYFGQIVILVLIQVGGLGFMSIISLVIIIFKRKMSTKQRKVAMQATGMFEIGDVNSTIKRVVFYTILFESIGTGLLMIEFLPKYGLIGIYYSVFTSISAFCNAGFALFSTNLVDYYSNPLVLLTVMFLIIFGGIGFYVWENLFRTAFRWRKFTLNSKIVLVGTLIMIVIPAILFFVFEINGKALEGMTLGEKILNSFFLSVTCRTAGFNTFDLSKLTNSSLMLCNVLMLIGGCSGSTAGGVKLTTIIVLALAIISAARKSDVTIGKRRIEDGLVRQASAIFVFYLILLNTALLAMLAFENWFGTGVYSFQDTLFESISAIATVGLSTLGTANLSRASQILLILLMYVGRTGGLTIIFIFTERNSNQEGTLKLPSEKVLIG